MFQNASGDLGYSKSTIGISSACVTAVALLPFEVRSRSFRLMGMMMINYYKVSGFIVYFIGSEVKPGTSIARGTCKNPNVTYSAY